MSADSPQKAVNHAEVFCIVNHSTVAELSEHVINVGGCHAITDIVAG